MKKLPDTLHGLLDLAIKDMEALEKRKDVKFDMDSWMDERGKVCYVCMAGAVMFNTLKIRLDGEVYDSISCYFTHDQKHNEKKIKAIDKMRLGRFRSALGEKLNIEERFIGNSCLKKLENEYYEDIDANVSPIYEYPQFYLNLFKKYQKKLKELNL